MGGVSADGRVLWLSGRYNAEVYAIDTRTGKLLARIPVGLGPHGLCVFPQPSLPLGHTGNALAAPAGLAGRFPGPVVELSSAATF
jgi:YVTN family beta-propeller protein